MLKHTFNWFRLFLFSRIVSRFQCYLMFAEGLFQFVFGCSVLFLSVPSSVVVVFF